MGKPWSEIKHKARRPKPSIYWTLFQLWRVWRRVPALRLGQLIVISVPAGDDVFYLRDEFLIKRLQDTWR